MQFIKLLLDEYGYSVLFISLMLELIALPLPGETLMSYCGYLVYIGTLNWTISVILAALGTIIGITISYFIGRTLGIDFLNKFGRYLHIKPESFEKVSKWFEKYGCGILVISYFIPGVRHLTGYFAGITKISLKKFSVSAYAGAFLWSFTFITLGKFLGSGWSRFHTYIKRYFVFITVVLVILVLMVFVYKFFKKKL
ncbi:hypothetical protein CPAST_c15690 [Clostridium pasteurianum DSM 525 = ATCC 6013]|uniref:SNARE associated protein n=1 Tax=Clostridium pasteurianum DSM 525 = ATCC 6013 TaxID=1262449 RepID=A0A0H3J2I2_CLOPA|nr:DedA family protein [Clostridium pasteurianum]AJA47644.1 hypothetical protein CPAST_c15690 [Clostridium pasteurianum DSM 525 = ATCC 6013]AJA51632.1 hypothetical protein CLPA_c15690 [Clostridium pasteurianum DSM 525 = ATCC 6013]ELP58016.1 hypothetical protein F502_16255 [Clostridium pasteurianum DSM 525 = ATCC 6013]KRU12361.1 SNARE associated protein [Clostridium pasteurianum DSM 525 = ATCC 6013]UZW15815.1 DedA family protein [Clostridium pasteurianum]